MPAVVCLDPTTIQRLLDNHIAADEVEQIAAHMERCGKCNRIVQGMPPERLVALMRAAESLPPQSDAASHLKTLIQKMLNVRGNIETLDQLSLVGRTMGGATTPPQSTPSQGPSSPFIGRYRLLRELGRGGMGTVFEAEDTELRRHVALKVPHFNGPAEQQTQMRQRFLREARAAAAVEHPYVCKIHDVGEHNGTPYVVMAFIEGPSLAGRLAKVRRVNDRAAVTLTLRIAEALLAVHAKGIIHRDLKPANILLPKDGTPILTDFGLAHLHTESGQLTGEGALLGTPAYMAPEQAVTELGPITTRTDLYSLAVVLYQMVTGRLPVEGDTMQILAHHAGRKAAPPPSQFRHDLDPALDAIVRKAMSFRPEDRYTDVGEFSQVLKDWLRSTAARPGGTGATPPASPGHAMETMSPLPAVPTATLAQPAIAPVAPHLTDPQPPVLAFAQAATVTDPPPVPTPGKASGRRGVIVSVAALLVLGGGGLLLSPLFRDKVDKKPTGEVVQNKDDGKPKDKPIIEQPSVKGINEDFKKASEEQRGLPEGWIGEDFRVPKQKQGGMAWLEANKPDGEFFVNLPHPLPLSGDFSIAGEYELYSIQQLTLRLKGAGDHVLNIVIEGNGSVTIAGDRRLPPNNYKYTTNTPFRITREGEILRVWLHEDLVVTKTLKEVVGYDTLTLGLKVESRSQVLAKLYSLKVGPIIVK